MFRPAPFVFALLAVTSSVLAADKPDMGPSAIQRKLHGRWVGGPCIGELNFRPDGSFERKYYSPGGHTLKGVWELKWDALPPTLVMECKESTKPQLAGWVLTVKLLRLNDEHFTYQETGDDSVQEFERTGLVRAKVVYGSSPRNEQVADVEPWISNVIAKADFPMAVPYTDWIVLSSDEKRLYTSPQGGCIIDGKVTEKDGQFEIEINGCEGIPLRASVKLKPGEQHVINLKNDSEPTQVFIALEAAESK